MKTRGFTLIELLVGISIAVMVTAAAVAFASHETRLMGLSRERVDTAQKARGAMDLMVQDIARAGMGVRYDRTGFGAFPQTGAQSIVDANGRFRGPLNLTDGWAVNVGADARSSDVLALVMADGSYATICGANGNTLSYCIPDAEGLFDVGEGIVLLSPNLSLSAARTVRADGVGGVCVGNTLCDNATIGAVQIAGAPDYPSLEATAADLAEFVGGEIAGGLKTVVWAVDADGALRRAEITQDNVGACPDASCGGTMISNVDFFAARVWRYENNGWQPGLYPAATASGRRPYRVDVELVVNSGKDADRPTNPIMVSGLAWDDPRIQIPAVRDELERFVFRTSVMVKNSGDVQ